MFHVELRQSLHVARAFNLSRGELDAQILGPWVTDAPIDLQDRRWRSDRSKLTILEGASLRPDEIGMGRGWSNATRSGQDVTDRMLQEARQRVGTAPAAELKEAIVEVCGRVPVRLVQVVELVAAQAPRRRPSELLAIAEQAVWELLHHGRVTMSQGGESVEREQWQPVLLSWQSWTESGPEVALQQADPEP
jgi:hypothetical protein